MGWNFKPVDAPKSAVRVDLTKITSEEEADFEEAVLYSLEHPAERMLLEFTSAEARDQDRVKIRHLSQARDPRVKASVWDASKEDDTPPVFALSVAWTVYVNKTATEGASE